MKKQLKNYGCRLSVLEKIITEDRNTIRELQKEVEGLKSSLEKALNSHMPKIYSLLSDRTRGVNNVSTVSASVVVSPAATSKAKEENKLPVTKPKMDSLLSERTRSEITVSTKSVAVAGTSKAKEENKLPETNSKMDSLLGARTGTEDTVSTVSVAVAVAPAATSKANAENEFPATKSEMDSYKSLITNMKKHTTRIPHSDSLLANNEEKLPATSSTPGASATSIFQAAEIGDIATLLIRLKSGSYVNQRNGNGFTLLHLAVTGGQEKTVKALLDEGASVNARGPSWTTSLHIAAEKDLLDIVKLLLGAGANINAKDTDNISPLMLAAKRRHLHLVKLLIVKGASLDECDSEGNSALLLAVKQSHSDVVKLLIEKGASLDNCDRERKSSLWYAVERGANDVVKLLIDKGASGSLGQCPLSLASERGNTKAIILMLQCNNPPDNNAIMKALYVAKDVSVVLAFEDARPGILKTREVEGVMRKAAREGSLHSLKTLLDAGVNVKATGEEMIGNLSYGNVSALYIATKMNQTQCVKLLSERGGGKMLSV